MIGDDREEVSLADSVTAIVAHGVSRAEFGPWCVPLALHAPCDLGLMHQPLHLPLVITSTLTNVRHRLLFVVQPAADNPCQENAMVARIEM